MTAAGAGTRPRCATLGPGRRGRPWSGGPARAAGHPPPDAGDGVPGRDRRVDLLQPPPGNRRRWWRTSSHPRSTTGCWWRRRGRGRCGSGTTASTRRSSTALDPQRTRPAPGSGPAAGDPAGSVRGRGPAVLRRRRGGRRRGAAAVAGLLRRAADQARLIGDHVVAERSLAAALQLIDPADTATLCNGATGRHAALYSLGRLDEADAEYRTSRTAAALDRADGDRGAGAQPDQPGPPGRGGRPGRWGRCGSWASASRPRTASRPRPTASSATCTGGSMRPTPPTT